MSDKNLPKGFQPGAIARRDLGIAPASYSANAHTVDAVFSTGARVLRYYGWEELGVSPDNVDLGRVRAGQVKLLDSHNASTIECLLGSVTDVRFESGAIVGTLAFAQTEEGMAAEAMVARGELTGLSIVYAIKAMEKVGVEDSTDVWRATRWELCEVSFVTVPADPSAQVRGLTVDPEDQDSAAPESAAAPAPEPDAMDPLNQVSADEGGEPDSVSESDPKNPQPNLETEESRLMSVRTEAPVAAPVAPALSALEALELTGQARNLGVGTKIEDLIRADASLSADQVRHQIVSLAATAQAERKAIPAGSAAVITRDGFETEGARVTDALIARMTGKGPSDKGREFMGYRAVELLAMRMGLDPRQGVVDPSGIISRAMHTTSDFPLLTEAAANKVLLEAYGIAAPTYRNWAKQIAFNDFKVHKLLRLGDFPALSQLPESGDISGGTLSENRETVTPVTSGVVVPFSRQLLMNDDLAAFGNLVTQAGYEAARTENAMAYALLALNSGAGPTMSDTGALYNNTVVTTAGGHANLGTAAAISTDSLGLGRAAMRKQRGIGGVQILNLAPSILLVGPDRETLAQQVVAPIQAVQAGNVPVFSGTLQVIVDANITGNAWYLFADPAFAPAFVYGYVAGQTGPQIATGGVFNQDGIMMRVLHDFGVGASDWRPTYRNAGA
jgi:HK97 family phage prohead protease